MNKKLVTLFFLLMFCGHSIFSATATWDLNRNGAWNIDGNWTPATFPNAQDDTAILGPVIRANRRLSLGQDITIGSLSINDNNNYRIQDSFTLIFDSTTTSTITVSSTGDHDIRVPVSLLSDLTISQGSTKRFTFFNPISGAQAITKNGSGELRYQGSSANTYSGLTTVNAGELILNKNAGINGIAGNLLIAGGLVKMQRNNQLSGSTNVTVSSGTFDLNKKIETISSLSMSGGSVTLGGSAGASLSLTSVDTALTMGDGASISEVGTVNLTGGSGGGVIYNGTAIAATISSTLDLGSAVRTFDIANGTATSDMEISGVISGLGGITKIGTGTLILSGTNTYAGGTILSGGSLSIAADNNLGNASGTLSFNDGTLLSTTGFSSSRAVTLSGTGTVEVFGTPLTMSGIFSGSGTLIKDGVGTLILRGTNTYAGGTILSGGSLSIAADNNLGNASGTLSFNGGTLLSTTGFSSSRAVTLSGTGTVEVFGTPLTMSGIFSGSGTLIKDGVGTLILRGTNTYAGGTTVSTGVLQGTTTSLQGTINNNSSVIFDQTTTGTYSGVMSGSGSLTKQNTGTLILSGANTYAGGTTVSTGVLQGTTISLQGTINNNSSVIFDQTTTGTYSGVMSGSGSLTKQNTGTLILSGANTYAGGTTVSTGVLQGTTISLQGTINNNSSVIFDQTTTGTYSGVMSGSGSLTKQNTGTLILSGANTYAGGTTVSTGVLQGTTTSLQGTINNNSSVIFDQEATGTYSGAMFGSGALTKTGLGKVTLSGINTYSGGTLINGGILRVSNINNLGTGNITLNGGALESSTSLTLTTDIDLNGTEEIDVLTGTLALSCQVTGDALVKTGTGTLSLSRVNTYTGLSTVNAGILELSDSGTLGSGNGLIVNGGSFVIATGAGTKTIGTLNGGGSGINLNNNILEVGSGAFSEAISGTGGAFTKNGSGTLTLSGNNTFTGDLSIDQGTLNISIDSNLGMGNLVLNGGTLSLSASITTGKAISVTASSQIDTASGTNLTVSGAISGTNDLTKSSTGTMSLTGNSSTFTGRTTVQQGTLDVTGVLGGPVTVSSPSFLQGTGSVGTVQNNGTVIPGASIGTLVITGDYTQDSSASLIIEIDDNPLLSDLLLISGTANLDGSVGLNPLPGIYEEGMVFTFLQASTINGIFSQLLEVHPLEFTLNYLANSVRIIIPFTQAVLPLPISELGGNAKNIAKSLFSCSGSLSLELDPILRSLVKISPGNFSAALLQLGPQQFGSLVLSNLQTSARVGLSMNRTSDTYENYYLTPCYQSFKDPATSSDQSIWFNPIGYYYKQNEMQEQVSFNNRTYGFTAGFSTCLFNQVVLSAGTGYTHSRLNWFKNNGDAHIQSVYLSPSVGYVGEYGYAGLVLLGSRSFYEVNRKIHFSNFKDKAHNDHKSYDLLVGCRGSLKLKFPENFQKNIFLLPTVNLDYLNIFESGYQESGAGAVNLSVKNVHSAFLLPEVKFKLLKEFNTRSVCSAPSIYVGWLKNIPLTNGTYTSRFYKQETCTKNFTVQSYHSSTDQLILGAEVLVAYKDNCSLKLGYEANLGNHYNVQEGNLNFNWTF